MKNYIIAAMMLQTCVTVDVDAQTLHVISSGVDYAFPASQTGEMPYQDGKTLTVMGKTFSVSDISRMYVDDSEVTDNKVCVNYNGTSASVVVAGNVAQYVNPVITNAHVDLVQSADVSADNCGEITYTLSGASTDGEFTLEGSYKSTIELAGLTLANPNGAPLNILNGKRIALSVKKDTENTLTDMASGEQKGCVVCKGHLELKGKGILNVYGNTAHGIHSKEYVEMKNCMVNILSAKKDGVNCNQYFYMESGTLNISNVGDDGVQVSYKDDTDRETEDTGALTIDGGVVNVTVTSASSKGIKAIGDITINGGAVNVTATGRESEGIESKAVLTVNDGTIVVAATDDAINSASHMYIKGGNITVVSSGNDGLDSNGNMYISGGVTRAFGTTAPECGIDANEEEGYSVYFNGGSLLAVGGGNSVPSSSASTQPYVTASVSVTAGGEVSLKNGSTVLASFIVPDNYSASSSGNGFGGMGGFSTFGPGGHGGPGGPGGPGGQGGGSSVLISCAGLASGSSYTMTCGSSSSTVTASLKGNSNSGGRPW